MTLNPLDPVIEVSPDNIAVARLRGELDLATAGRITDLVLAVVAEDTPLVILDLSEVTFCDSQGLSTFVRIANRAEADGGRLKLTGVPPKISRLLRITGLDTRFGERDNRKDPLAALTDQERQILELIGDGLTNRQIGEQMFLAEKTVKNYVSNLFAKLNMNRRTQAAAFAARLKASAPKPKSDGEH